MNREEIVKLANQFGICDEDGCDDNSIYMDEKLELFYNFIAAAEREACAKVADRHSTCANDTPNVIAVTIRARGQQ